MTKSQIMRVRLNGTNYPDFLASKLLILPQRLSKLSLLSEVHVNCPSCGEAVQDDSSGCPKCGIGLRQASRVVVAPETMKDAAPKSDSVVLVVLGILFLALILGAISLREYARSFNSAYAIGTAIGTVLFPTIGVLIFYRNRRSLLSRKLFVLSAWWLGAFLITSSAMHKGFTKEEVPQLARQALGKETVTDTDDERELIRGFFRKVKSENERYLEEVQRVDPKMASLALAQESFRDAGRMDMMSAHFKDLLDIEQRHEENVRGLLGDFTKEIDKQNWSAEKKEQFRTGASTGFNNQLRKRAVVYEAETEFLTSALELYGYARTNSKYFIGHGDGTVAVSNNRVLAEFNEKVNLVNAKREAYLKQQEAFDAEQKKSMGAMGLTMEDFGVRQSK